ncbi:hypothetical protein OAH87_06710 [Marinomonas sp.]|nr:hypothetical protein [Marinomonas sp.]MDB4838137.1 hypothetical protein [Marinomonas sp.]
MKYIPLLLSIFILSGCSYKGAYESVQFSNLQQCYTLPQSQQDACIESTQKSYDDYERERKI